MFYLLHFHVFFKAHMATALARPPLRFEISGSCCLNHEKWIKMFLCFDHLLSLSVVFKCVVIEFTNMFSKVTRFWALTAEVCSLREIICSSQKSQTAFPTTLMKGKKTETSADKKPDQDDPDLSVCLLSPLWAPLTHSVCSDATCKQGGWVGRWRGWPAF